MQQNNTKKEFGFTLVEMMVVLSIVMTLSSFSYFHLSPIIQKQIIRDFIQQLQEDIWLAQEYALSHSKQTEIYFVVNESKYELRERGFRSLLVTRDYHHGIEIVPLTITNPITFTSSGNINLAGSLYVKQKSKTYKVTFKLGKGRFSIEEL